ncbi:MAG: hypothetical protein CVT99_08570 [Bacteroidetes bacterium HGW-Bacteroidetes-16]|jgi:hypothetical protein|nr:MAG: hypothetical protein CVT99_08570 [Bacteroidetes bacterium HGW-Bacteroidetes-16]
MKQTDELYRNQFSEVNMPQFRFIGWLLSLAGGFMLWKLNPIGFILFVAGMVLAFFREGIEIRIMERQFRSYISIFSIFMGKWKPLPEIEYITLFNERVNQEAWMLSIHGNTLDEHIKVALVHGNHQQIPVGIFKDKEMAVEAATKLATQLGTKLLDYTTKDPAWVIE